MSERLLLKSILLERQLVCMGNGTARPSNNMDLSRLQQCADPPAYLPKPRMARRGAVSYETSDTCAEYIRFLGDALNRRQQRDSVCGLPELPANKLAKLNSSRRKGRRGSIQPQTASRCYKDLLKGSILESVGVEEQAQVINDKLKNVDSWDFDVFAFRRVTEGRPLFYMGLHLLQKHGLIDTFNLDILKVMKFLALVEEGYHPDNSYHNCTHAADVTQALHCLLYDPNIYSFLSPLEIFSCLIAAMVHDLDHPGVNQNFLLNTSSYLASIHGANSTLENHHYSSAKAVLNESRLLDHLSSEEKQNMLSMIEDLILATDVNRHKEFMAKFESVLTSSDIPIDLTSHSYRKFILMIAIKAADISNPARCLYLSKMWSEHIMEEFFRQGDWERTLNIPISFLCDRHSTAVPKSQSGFFEFVALPLFKAWSKLSGSRLSQKLCQNILNNKSYWDNIIHNGHESSDSEDS